MALEERDVRLSLLRELYPLISSALDREKLLALIIDSATRLMEAKASSLLLVDPKSKRLYFHLATGEKGEEVKKFVLEPGQGIAGAVARTGQALWVPDVNQDPRWFSEISRRVGLTTRSIACAPLRAKGEVIGVIEIIDREDGQPLREEDMEILQVFADLAASVLETSRVHQRLIQENVHLREELEAEFNVVAESPAMTAVIQDAGKVAHSRTTTLISGESGTGKELIARLIHRLGPRAEQRLITVNCGAFPENLLESELFGHERGAFTGATARKQGLVELADGGTLFLDEVSEMSGPMQVRLLRVLQEGSFHRVGDPTPRTADLRVIAATNKDLYQEVQTGRFRDDLYYRLNVVHLEIPPLRDRPEDIAPLCQYFLDVFRRELGLKDLALSPEALKLLQSYDWPGNVRELKNILERAAVMGSGREITPEDLPLAVQPGQIRTEKFFGQTYKEAVESFKREFLRQNLWRHQGRVGETAATLGLQRTYLSRLIAQYSLRSGPAPGGES